MVHRWLTAAIIACLVVASGAIAQQPAPPPALSQRPDRAAFPDADGVILREVVEITIVDGKVTRRHRTLTTILRENMMRGGFCDPRIRYDAARETVDVAVSRTWMADGTPVETDPKVGRIEVTPDAFARSPDYSHRRELVVVHTGVEHGATMELDYTTRAKEPTDGALFFEVPLAGRLPIVRQTIRIRVPEGEVVALHVDGVDVAPAKTTADGFDICTIERENIAAINVDEAGKRARTVIPLLVGSRVASWADVGSRLAKRITTAAVASDRIKARVESLVNGKVGRRERVNAVHRFVARSVRTVPWPLARFGFAVRPAAATAESGYGHALDKAVLLHTMLQHAGIASVVSLGSPTPKIRAQVPSPGQLDDVWVEVEAGDDRWWLDPAEAASVDDRRAIAGCMVLRLVSHGASISRVSDPRTEADRASLHTRIAVARDGSVSAELTYEVAGAGNPYAAVQADRDAADAILERVVRRLGGARVESVSASHLDASRATLHARAIGGQLPAADVGAIELRLPEVPDSLARDDIEIFRLARSTPLELPRAGQESTRTSVRLPSGVRVLYRPRPVKIENAVGSFTVEVDDIDGALEVRRTLTVARDTIGPADYPALRQLIGAARARRNTVILFAPIAE